MKLASLTLALGLGGLRCDQTPLNAADPEPCDRRHRCQ